MGFFVVVQFAVKYCVGVFAWPLLALGYPLCASVWAMENNSISDTKKLNAYWVVLSLILLLEHALNLLNWLLLWQHIRLMIVCWLVIPYFDGALYVYKHLIRPCLTMDLQNVINCFNRRMKSLYAKDNFLAEMEKFVKENGSEALEQIIALKSGGTKQNLDVKDIKAAPSTENKEVEQLDSERPTVTQKDIRPVEVLEKNEVKAPKQDSGVHPNVTRVENRNFADPEIKKPFPEVATQRGLPQTPASTKGQKWTCEICNITLQSVVALDYHLDGKNHQAAVEALKAKNQSSGPKVVHNFAGPEIKKPVREVAAQRELPQTSASSKGQQWTCEICHMTLHCVTTLNSHLQGKKHEAAVEALKAKNPSSGEKWTCEICHMTLQSVSTLNSHLQGKKHQAASEALKAKNPSSCHNVVLNFAGPEIEKPVREVAAQRELPQTSASSKGQKWTCEICHMTLHCVTTLNSHLQGRKHEAAVEALIAKNPSSGEKWTCEICHMTLQSVSTLNSHLQGKKHQAASEALKAKNPSSCPNVVLNFAGPSGPKVVLTFISKDSNVPNVEQGKSGSKKGYPGNADVRGQQRSNPASIPRKSVQTQQPKKPNKQSCSICNVKCSSETDMASHLGGIRHLTALKRLST